METDQPKISKRRLVQIFTAMKERGLDIALLGPEHWLGAEEAAWVFFHKEEAWRWAEAARARLDDEPLIPPPWTGKLGRWTR